MKLTVVWIGKTKDRAIDELTDKYVARIAHYASVECAPLRDEEKLLHLVTPRKSAVKPTLVLLDSRGKQFSSEDFAEFLGRHQENSASHLLFAIGAADGFSEPIRSAASFTIALGKVTLAHELARVVLLEQLYRAFTILKGHPYHIRH